MSPNKNKKNRPTDSTLSSVLTRNSIRQMAGSVYFGRGDDYFKSGLVGGLVDFDGRITAKVNGTYQYEVNLWVEEGELAHSCTCPLGEDEEFCKHCVATGLEWINQQNDQNNEDGKSTKGKVNFEDVKDYLLTQDKQALVETILDQARSDDRLRLLLLSRTARASIKGVDLDTFRAVIDNALEFDDYTDDYSRFDYTEGIDETIDAVEDMLGEGHAAEVVDLAEYALAAIEGALTHVDDSGGYIWDLLDRLQEVHFEACEKAMPDPEELAERLFHMELNSYWDVFSNAVENYSEVLGHKGVTVYRQLTEKQWESLQQIKPGGRRHSSNVGQRYRITNMMESLARQTGDIEELVKVKSRDLSKPYYFQQIAEIYKEARKFDKALDWAERGVKAFPKKTDSKLLEFIADEYHRAKRHDEALNQIWAIFTNSPMLEKYKLLKSHADKIGAWPEWREKAISLIRKKSEKNKVVKEKNRWDWSRPDNSDLVEIFLWEKDVEAAWHTAQTDVCRKDLWLELAKKREKFFPEDAIKVYRTFIEPTIEQKDKPAYKEAVGYIKIVSALMNRMDRKDEFLKYLESIKTAHKRKRNFIKLLESARFS